MVSEQQIQAVADRIRKAAPDSTIILFGSHARGDAGEHSDVDLLVIEPVVDSRHGEIVRLSDAVDSLDVPTDILVVSAAVYEEWADEPGTVIREAAREGRALHAATAAASLTPWPRQWKPPAGTPEPL
jgi:uncharacterized protein